jgi:IMP cyclohydrolase
MYIGRIVSVAKTPDDRIVAAYRVSSRSFPNRKAVATDDKVSIVPKEGHEGDIYKNPYIAYNCVRIINDGQIAVVTNGSQTDPIAEKITLGMPIRDALVEVSLALDYEKDDYNTPRVSAIADRTNNTGWLAIVRDNGLEVREMPLEAGRFFYVATYEENTISPDQSGDYDATDAAGACEFIIGKGVFSDREKPVTAVAAVSTTNGFDLATKDVVPE